MPKRANKWSPGRFLRGRSDGFPSATLKPDVIGSGHTLSNIKVYHYETRLNIPLTTWARLFASGNLPDILVSRKIANSTRNEVQQVARYL